MKQYLRFVAILLLIVLTFSACVGENPNLPTTSTENPSESEPMASEAPTEEPGESEPAVSEESVPCVNVGDAVEREPLLFSPLDYETLKFQEQKYLTDP